MATTTTNKGLTEPAYNDTGWDTTLNTNFTILDNALGKVTAINVTGVATSPQTLSSAQYQGMSLAFSGTLLLNLIYQLPAGVAGQWVIQNSTTGAFTLTIASATGGGTSITVAQGAIRSIYCDGTNVVYADSQTTTAGADTQVIYNSGGTLAGSSAMTFNGNSLSTLVANKGIEPVYTTGTSTALVSTGTETSLVEGLQIVIVPNVTSGSGVTLNRNSLGAVPIKYNNAGTLTAIPVGALKVNAPVLLEYQSSSWVLQNPYWAVNGDTTSTGLLTDPVFVDASITNRFAQSIAANGYTKLPNGLILQWGKTAVPSGALNVSFPLTFPNACFSVVATPTSGGGNNTATSYIPSFTTSYFVWNPGNQNDPAYWFAIGW